MSIVERPPRLAPYDMFQRYLSLRVPRASKGAGDEINRNGPIIPFALNNYLCLTPKYGGADQAIKLKDILLGLTWGSGPKAPSLRSRFGLTGPELMAVFCGKGSPVQMETALSMVDFVIREMPDKLQKQFPKLVQLGIASMQDMQPQKSVLIGLDCNGFVGNWQSAAGFVGVSPENSIGFWPNRGRRKTLDEIHEFDVAPFADDSHIVVFDEVFHEGGKVYANIVQSTGRIEGSASSGPQYTLRHQITPTATPGEFLIHNNGTAYTSVVFTSAKKVKIVSSGFRDMPT